jgi:hypothetical protein
MEDKYQDEKPEIGPSGNSGNNSMNETGDIKDSKSENFFKVQDSESKPASKKSKLPKADNMQKSEPTSPTKVPTMVPIINLRTLIVVAVGAIVGLALGVVYYIMSPLLSSTDTSSNGDNEGGGDFLQWLAPQSTENVSWTTKIYVQLINPGSDYISLTDLNNRAQFYATKANSLPFYQYMTKELNNQAPMYSTNVSALEQMVRIRISNPLNSATRGVSSYLEVDTPSIEVKVTAPTAEKALYLARFVPDAFASYLDDEEKNKKAQEYNDTLKEIDNVKTELYKTQQEMNTLLAIVIMDNPNYIVLKTKVDELQSKLNEQTTQLLNNTYTSSELQQKYNETLETIITLDKELADTENTMDTIAGISNATENLTDPRYIVLTAKIDALKNQITLIMNGNTVGTTVFVGLAEMITNGDTANTEYAKKMKLVATASSALAEAQRELDALNNNNSIVDTVEYRVTQLKVEALNTKLSSLWDELRILTDMIVSETTQSTPQNAIDKTAMALMQAKKDLETLEKQLGYDSVLADLEKKVVQDKVAKLDLRMENLTTQLSSLEGNENKITNSQYLALDTPSIPTPILPQRSGMKTMLIFVLVGIVLGWGALNLKWIIKGMPSSNTVKKDENEER